MGRARSLLWLLGALAVLALTGAAFALAAGRHPAPRVSTSTVPTVSPAAGSAHGRFRVRFDAPRSSGIHGSDRVLYSVEAANADTTPRACVDRIGARPTASGPGPVLAILTAPAGGPGLCGGRWSGEVLELVEPVCGPVVNTTGGSGAVSPRGPRPEQLCPMFIQARPLGHFRFRVH